MMLGLNLHATTDDAPSAKMIHEWMSNIAQTIGDRCAASSISVSVHALDEPEPAEEGHTEATLFKVYDAIVKTGVGDAVARDLINALQNAGILFRERLTQPVVYTGKTMNLMPHSRACGISVHDHGAACAPDCPTCAGM